MHSSPSPPGTDPSDPGAGAWNGAGNGTGSGPDGDLAATGSDAAPWLLSAGIALILGATALLIARHRRHHTAD